MGRRTTITTLLVLCLAILMASPIAGLMGIIGSHENARPPGNPDETPSTSALGSRSVDYRWYDMFNVPFGSWWYRRWEVYHMEDPWGNTYPYIFDYHTWPSNVQTLSNMRLNITGTNMPEINMNSHPEFLPYLGTARGGNATIDWEMGYLTQQELVSRYGAGIANQDDGWIIDLNGTIVLDTQAAKAVLGMTDADYRNFYRWWSKNSQTIIAAYLDWIVYEATTRLDIVNAYDSYFQMFTFNMTAALVGANVVLTVDILTWGMEMLMARWLHEAFLPAEFYYEDMHFHAAIGDSQSDLQIDTAVDYSLRAYDSVQVIDGVTKSQPCWRWEPKLGDNVVSSVSHPHSDYDKYASLSYMNHDPGSPTYGTWMTYDYTPTSWNLTANETMSFQWPSYALFRESVQPGIANNVTDFMVVRWSEPMDSDMPGSVTTDNNACMLSFTGPIDAWDWSKNVSSTSHPFLNSEWTRLGGEILPYGMPMIEFGAQNILGVGLARLEVTMQDSVPANDFVSFTVTAYDQSGQVFTDYSDTVTFSSSDPLAVLPANYTFYPGPYGDNGVHTFIAEARFETVGPQTLDVYNISAPPEIHGQKNLTVLPIRTAASLQVDVYHMPSVGIPEDVTVTAYDQYGDLFMNYTGTVTFSTNRSADVSLPSDYTFQLYEGGVHTLAGGLTFTGTGWFTITSSDLSNSTIAGSDEDVNVTATPEVIDHFTVSGIQNMYQRQRSDVTVVAFDQFGYVFDRYSGTIHFSANDSGGTFPADYAFQPSDTGAKTFVKGVSFDVYQDTVFTVTVADTVIAEATGSQTGVVIVYKPSSETFRMYDLFEQPWGEWWKWRYPAYKTDIILTNESGKYTMIYNPDTRAIQGIIMAPYRWNFTAINQTQVSVNSPEFMPVLGPSDVPGAEASVNIYFEYLSTAWWDSYWSPYWNFPSTAMDAQRMDGYYPGITYNVTMNRAAALRWLGMPLTDDPASWWNVHGSDYVSNWEAWILNEGNNRLDIYSGYAWPYTDLGTKMKLSVLPNGDIYLEIGHLGEGYEILMTRWLNETRLNNHEPFFEDMSVNVKYFSDWADVNFDAVCQYSLRAVKANESATNEPAWAWDPLLIDYLPSYAFGYHPSTFDPWAAETYQSWSAGDPSFRNEVQYDCGMSYFNLTREQKFTIELPKGSNILGFYAQPMPSDSIYRIIMSGARGSPDPRYDKYPRGPDDNYNYSAYWPIMMNGTMSLGWYGNWTGTPYLDQMYDPISNTITMVGPMSFDNSHHTNGALYAGAPWIEFNVTLAQFVSPIAVAAATPNPAFAGDMVELNGTGSVARGGAISDFKWTFTYDGTPQEIHGQIAQFTFLTPGTYDITLNCTDVNGNSNTTTIVLVVDVAIPEFGSLPAVLMGFVAVVVITQRLRRKRG